MEKKIIIEDDEDFLQNDEDNADAEIFDESEELEIIVSDEEIMDDLDVVGLTDAVILSKSREEGKHSLKYDSIFKGKKEEHIDNESDQIIDCLPDNFEIDRGSLLYEEYRTSDEYLRDKKVKEKVYKVLLEKTDINFLAPRRKPSKIDFNTYYHLIKVELKDERFSNIELFNELSVYFSDNLLNMFKLLDNKWRNELIHELQTHIGKNDKDMEITNRNLLIETEVEFEYYDIMGDMKRITGVIVDSDYENSTFLINSFENLYEIKITQIIRILNKKFKFNLNMLNNIDFL